MKRSAQRGGPAVMARQPATPAWQQSLLQGLQHHQAGRLDTANSLYRNVLRIAPNEPDALHLLGVLMLQRGDPAQAVSLIQRAISRRGNVAVYHSNLGAALRTLGQVAEARRALERAVALDPNHVDALVNLGDTLRRLGEYEAAEGRFRAALALVPGHLQALVDLGGTLQALQRYDEAMGHYRQALTLDPTSAPALSSLGVALTTRGQIDEALPYLEQAAAIAPNDPSVVLNLAVALHGVGRFDEAAARYRQILALDAEHVADRVQVQHSLGRALQAANHLDEALASLEKAQRLAPEDASIATDLAGTLWRLGRQADAITMARRAIKLVPSDAGTLRLLGDMLREVGQFEEAARVLAEVIELDPTQAEARRDLGSLIQHLGKFDGALTLLAQVTQDRPDDWESWANLGIAFDRQGSPESARTAYARSLEIEPTPGIRLRYATLLPAISRSHDDMLSWRARWAREVGRLHDDGLRLEDVEDQLGQPSFFLAYHGLNDRPLQEQIARLYLDACPSLAWVAPHCRPGAWVPPTQRPDGRIRVGFPSRFLSNHTIGKFMRGIIARLDRERFEVTVFQTGKSDEAARRIAAQADHAFRLEVDLAHQREQIAARELDVLFYPDIGMETATYILGLSRLAPVQCVTWGHPVTTGIPNVDAFLSADVLEPPGAEEHYSERLIRLGRLPTWYERPIVPAEIPDRPALGLPEDATLYVCPQSLFKLHPDFDAAIAGILRRDPRGRLVLIEGASENWGRLVRERLGALAPDVMDRVLMLPHLPEDRFFGLLRAADVLLDPFHFGGGNTTYEAFAVGTPIVTWPGALMRGRVTVGAYRQMGVDGPIASSAEEYVEIAVALANDRAWRTRLGEQIQAAAGCLYEDDAAIDEIEAYLERAVADAAARPASAGHDR